MRDLLPVLNVTPGLKSALLDELHEAMARLAHQQPDDPEWQDLLKVTEECKAKCSSHEPKTRDSTGQ
jgi:hypothetical protein